MTTQDPGFALVMRLFRGIVVLFLAIFIYRVALFHIRLFVFLKEFFWSPYASSQNPSRQRVSSIQPVP